MALIRRESSFIWYVDFRDQSGRRHRISTGTSNHRTASQIENRIKSDVASGKFLGVHRGQITLQNVLDNYVRWQKTLGKRWDRSDLAARNILNILDPNHAVANLNVRDVERFHRTRLEHVKPGTVQRETNTLQAAINRAVVRGELNVNPIAGRIRQMKVAPRNRVLGDDEVNRLLIAARNGPPYLLPGLSLMLGCGLRRGEALQLLWRDVDLNAGSIIVHAQKTKTTRTVPLPPWVQEMLAAIPQTSATVIATSEGKAIASIKNSFRSCCKRADVEGVCLHDLRRSYATRLAKSGVSPWILKELLGHQSLRTSEIYVTISDSAMRRAVLDVCQKPEGLTSPGMQSERKAMQSFGHI